MEVPVAMPVMEIRGWATKVNSNTKTGGQASSNPPWYAANQLLEVVRVACYGKGLGVFGRILDIQSRGVQYNGAVVLSTLVHMEPRVLYNDPRNYAVYSMEVGFTWKEINLVLD
jgi:hypothetical protein